MCLARLSCGSYLSKSVSALPSSIALWKEPLPFKAYDGRFYMEFNPPKHLGR